MVHNVEMEMKELYLSRNDQIILKTADTYKFELNQNMKYWKNWLKVIRVSAY